MAKYNLTIIANKGWIKRLEELFDFEKYNSLNLITVRDFDLIQVVSSHDEKTYKGYGLISKEEYEDLVLLPEMYPVETISFFEKHKSEIELYNFNFTGIFGLSFVNESLRYISENINTKGILILEDKLNLIHPFSKFFQMEINDHFLENR